jgi:hypothetical protein
MTNPSWNPSLVEAEAPLKDDLMCYLKISVLGSNLRAFIKIRR